MILQMMLLYLFLFSAVEGYPTGNSLIKCNLFDPSYLTKSCNESVGYYCEVCWHELIIDSEPFKYKIVCSIRNVCLWRRSMDRVFNPTFHRQDDLLVHNFVKDGEVTHPSTTALIAIFSSLFGVGCVLILAVHLYFRRRLQNIRSHAKLMAMQRQAPDNEYTEMSPPASAKKLRFQFDPNTDISQNTHCRLELIETDD